MRHSPHLVTFPDDLTEDQAHDGACEQDFQIADAAVAAVEAIEEGNIEEADRHLAGVLDLNENMRELAEIGGLDNWVEYSDGLKEHTEKAREAIEEGREWDAFEAAVEIPEMAEEYLGRSRK